MATDTTLPRGEIIQQMDGVYELFPVPVDQDSLWSIMKDCLAEWEHIRIGPLIPGAVWEIKLPSTPRIGFQDGYMTMDFQSWHCHLCIGETKSCPPDIGKHRRTGRAELYRRLNPDSQPTSWGFRMFNGAGEQQVTVLLPNPHLDEDQNFVDRPDWSRLYLWDRLTSKYLGRPEDPIDRTAPRFFHG